MFVPAFLAGAVPVHNLPGEITTEYASWTATKLYGGKTPCTLSTHRVHGHVGSRVHRWNGDCNLDFIWQARKRIRKPFAERRFCRQEGQIPKFENELYPHVLMYSPPSVRLHSLLIRMESGLQRGLPDPNFRIPAQLLRPIRRIDSTHGC